MIKAIFLVVCIGIVVTAIVMIVNFANSRTEVPKYEGMEYDEKTKTYYNPEVMERTESKGVISFKSKK